MAQDMQNVKKGDTVETRYRKPPQLVRVIFYIFTVLAVLFAIEFFFSLGIGGYHFSNWEYYYALIALLLPFVFIFIPAWKNMRFDKIPWYDSLLAVITFFIAAYFAFNAREIELGGWAMHPTPFNFVSALILSLLVLESSRRTGGNLFCLICLFFGAYPLFGIYMPGIFKAPVFELPTLVGHVAFDSEGFMGIPMQVVGGILLGFLVFSGLLIKTGAGAFFLDMAMVLAGRFRGGPAKVGVIGSAFFGSLSGSIFANIAGTGSVTIPAMKKLGYPPHRAGAIEACSSTGGVLMPPVMGAVAFVMASMTNIPYASIMLAAFVPSLLYYLGLLLQVDAFAAKAGLKGMPREMIPRFWVAFKDGWHFVFVLFFLVWGLVIMRLEATTPFYASGLLIIFSMLRKKTRLDWEKLILLIDGVGKLLVDPLGIIIPLGLIVSGLVITGVAPSFTAGIIELSGGNPYVALILGTVTCYLLGMVGMLTPAYIFLAMSLAPVLIASGFSMLATHLFIIYYAMLSAITPPVAAGSFLAAAIAGSHPIKTAWASMKMGIVIYIVPFFFIFEPSLILQGPLKDVLFHFITAIIGVYLLSAGVEGYVLFNIGRINSMARAISIAIGLLWIVPALMVTVAGAALTIPFASILWLKSRAERRRTVAETS